MKNKDLYTRFDHIFFEKTRLSIITLIYREDTVSFNRFKIILKATDGALYTHLKKLINAGYIESKKTIENNSPKSIYNLTKEGKKIYKEYLKFLESMLKDEQGGDL